MQPNLKTNRIFTDLSNYVDRLDIHSIAESRKAILQPLIDFIQDQRDNQQIINLNFICTHNSRRSHLSQVWAQTIASYFNLDNVFCYSGGTEATALFETVTITLKNVGFAIEVIADGKNPIYSIKYSDVKYPIVGFSKTYDAEFNPSSEFAAIMTCSSADGGCPYIPGAKKRVPITYEDPKAFDGTNEQLLKYEERSKQIATEMKFVFSQIK